MELTALNNLFGNLYKNKIILHKGATFFCDFINFSFDNDILTVKLKALEPALKLKPRYKNEYEKIEQKESFEISYDFTKTKIFGLDKQEISGIYCAHIWGNYDLVKKVFTLKSEGKEQEIHETLWE